LDHKCKIINLECAEIHELHFTEAARQVKLTAQDAEQILYDMLMQVAHVIETIQNQLEPDFPKAVSDPIFQGMIDFKKRF